MNLQCIPTPQMVCGADGSALVELTGERTGTDDVLEWTAQNVEGVHFWLIYQSAAVDGELIEIGSVPVAVLTTTITATNTTHDYQIVGIGFGITGPFSNRLQLADALPPAIEPPVVTGWNQNGVDSSGYVYWTHPWQSDPGDGVSYLFEVQNVTTASGWQGAGSVISLSDTDELLNISEALGATPNDGDEIEVRMRAFNGTDYSEFSNVLGFTYSI